jgi:hypothetical protein
VTTSCPPALSEAQAVIRSAAVPAFRTWWATDLITHLLAATVGCYLPRPAMRCKDRAARGGWRIHPVRVDASRSSGNVTVPGRPLLELYRTPHLRRELAADRWTYSCLAHSQARPEAYSATPFACYTRQTLSFILAASHCFQSARQSATLASSSLLPRRSTRRPVRSRSLRSLDRTSRRIAARCPNRATVTVRQSSAGIRFLKLANLYEELLPIFERYGFKPQSAGVVC